MVERDIPLLTITLTDIDDESGETLIHIEDQQGRRSSIFMPLDDTMPVDAAAERNMEPSLVGHGAPSSLPS